MLDYVCNYVCMRAFIRAYVRMSDTVCLVCEHVCLLPNVHAKAFACVHVCICVCAYHFIALLVCPQPFRRATNRTFCRSVTFFVNLLALRLCMCAPQRSIVLLTHCNLTWALFTIPLHIFAPSTITSIIIRHVPSITYFVCPLSFYYVTIPLHILYAVYFSIV